ncbi:MAG: site-specific DNA-methyltransferase [Planctomycetaceae bacterium]|jgi:site-specific DNA-methyltransferase (adenine-specific)|nr:site-specific DNA-methyltransferase [Planctomycetaceae bacterium]
MSRIEIICGDSLLEMKKISDDSVDLIIADPPYNLGKGYGNLSDCQSFTDYLEFTRQWITESKRVLRQSGTIYIFVGFRMISYVYQILEQELKMNFVNWICWHYTQGIGKTKGFSPRHDDILMFTKSPNNYYFNLDSVRVPQKYYRSINNMRGANPGDVWEFSHVHYCNENRQQHPTQKPEGLIERMILASSDYNGNVLDPFAGSGTTPRVCQQTGRHCTGIEINPQYVAIINQRLKNTFTGFDSIDPRMERVPGDLNDPQLRAAYLENHVNWFLGNHQNQESHFWSDVAKKYKLPIANRSSQSNKKTTPQTLLNLDK